MRTTQQICIFFLLIGGMWNQQTCQAISVNTYYSSINYPFNWAYVNTQRPIITGSLLDDNRNPVSNETVEIFINGLLLGTTASNAEGIFVFQTEENLSDGQHVVAVFCVDSQLSLASHSFTIDTIAPSITIERPAEDETIYVTTFTVSGTTEANVMVETFLDDDTYGQLCYADESGAWSIEYSADIGLHAIKAQATDAAGNLGPATEIRNFTINS